MKKWMLAFSSLCVVTGVLADPYCTTDSLHFEQNNIVLNTHSHLKYHVYQFQNISDKTLLLDHSSADGMSAGWASPLAPGHVSLALVYQPDFTFSCAYIDAAWHRSVVSCAKVITACERINVNLPVSTKQGQYWLVENQLPQNVDAAIAQRTKKQMR